MSRAIPRICWRGDPYGAAGSVEMFVLSLRTKPLLRRLPGERILCRMDSDGAAHGDGADQEERIYHPRTARLERTVDLAPRTRAPAISSSDALPSSTPTAGLAQNRPIDRACPA